MYMSLPSKGKILALDLGTRRTGVAISDPTQTIAFQRDEIDHRSPEDLLKQLEPIVEIERIVGLLIGFPLSLDGQETNQTQKVKESIEHLKSHLKLPIHRIDERLTTKQAREQYRYMPSSLPVDSAAAQIMLETYISSI